jgi:large subunit ribosomal protein L1
MAKDTAAPEPAAEKPEKPEKAEKPKKAKAAPGAEAAPAEAKPAPPPEAKPATPARVPGTAATQADGASSGKKKKKPGVPPRRGKKLRNQLKNQQQKIAKEGVIPLKQALTALKSMKRAKFDETVEIHLKLGIDTTNSDQMVRGSVPLPHGIGKSVRIVVFCQGDDVAKAKEAGADFAGSNEIIDKIQKENWLDFDVALASQSMMGQVSRLGKVLGPRGLMPTPKAGTVIPANGDVAAAVKEFKAGKVEYRADKGGCIHAGVGKMSFDADKLAANITAFVDQVRAAKPANVKGHYIESVTVSATMSAGIRISI